MFRVLDQLESAIRRSSRIPLTGHILIDADRLLSILEKLRASLPEEMRQARYLTQENHRILREAHEKAESLVNQASRQAQQMVQESEILRCARGQAGEISDRAAAAAREIREGAETYAKDVLAGLEIEMERLADIIRHSKGKLEKSGEAPDGWIPQSGIQRAISKEIAPSLKVVHSERAAGERV